MLLLDDLMGWDGNPAVEKQHSSVRRDHESTCKDFLRSFGPKYLIELEKAVFAWPFLKNQQSSEVAGLMSKNEKNKVQVLTPKINVLLQQTEESEEKAETEEAQ
ncbi:hypothetical protein HPG69_009684 [Diceros bicornis minor]|uniref:Uncharacterized protein n=1 Tax=Diceros bicornis minor TaxID=77932 RepID=A0A7J7EXY3_DICBM|nr:hypothetical protein HPG69_009684 [Diceros bicornis minor]